MDGVYGLAESLRIGMKKMKKSAEQKAMRGTLEGGRVRIGARSYPCKAAVDIPVEEGGLVWVLLSDAGTAVIVGA